MSKLLLSEDQKAALQGMEEFLENDKRILVLAGYAGCGKSFLLNEFVQYIDSINKTFVLAAPTHRAKLVMEQFTGYDAITLHKLLSLSPELDIYHLDYNDLKFLSGGLDKVPRNGIIIVDEGSMVPDSSYDLILDYITQYNSKVIYVGDPAQLNPVGEGGSKVFANENILWLTQIHRQSANNQLIPLLTKLRKKEIRWFEPIRADEGSLFVYDDTKDFMLNSIPFFKKAMSTQDVNMVKVIAYTNKRVQNLNKCIRRITLGKNTENQYNRYEILTGYENFEYNKKFFYNSLDYVILSTPRFTRKKIPNFITLEGWQLELYDTIYKQRMDVFVIDRNINPDYLTSLASVIETIRIDAIDAKNRGNRTYANIKWKQYFQTMKSFASPFDLYWDNRAIKKKTFDYGYALTIHKIQGSSLNTIFVDMDDVNSCRERALIRQMQYVALSRTKTDAYILQK